MKYDFKSIINRKNSNSLKWDFFDDDYPMWVADMDFKVAPLIYEAVNKKTEHAIYGYSILTDSYFDSYINWWKKYNLDMKRDELLFASGVMPAITSIIRAFSSEGDNILIQTPVYHIFAYVIENNNRKVLENPLLYNPNSEDIETVYKIDFEDLEEKLSDPKTKIMLLCNPHNPIGRIWEKEDLEKIAILANEYNVLVVSDEIHCDLTDPDIQYTPFASIDNDLTNDSLTCLSPTKTFNIAGLQSSVVFTRNKEFYETLEIQLVKDFFSGPNVFTVDATIAAYQSEEWLSQLKEVLFENKTVVNDFLKENISEIKLVPSNATYLLWLDISKLNQDFNTDSNTFSEVLREEVGLFLSPGIQFGQNGDNFLRMNVACPKSLLKEGLNALKEGLIKFKNSKNNK